MNELTRKELRRKAANLERTMRDLDGLKDELAAAVSDDEVAAICAGERPLSLEVHSLTVLQEAAIGIEDGLLDSRSEKNERRKEE